MNKDTSSSDDVQTSSSGLKHTQNLAAQLFHKLLSIIQILKCFSIDVHTSDALTPGNHIAHLVWTRTQDCSCGFFPLLHLITDKKSP